MRKQKVVSAVRAKTDAITKSSRSKELNFWIRHNGEEKFRVTIPKGRGELPKGTENSIRKQLRLDKTQFRAFVDCDMTAAGYKRHLDELAEKGQL